jgi:2-hydroxy-3-keto-5-methylthiopentenyl-1-phosphate phosphatase
MNIKETLNWCKEHDVSFKIIDVAGFKTVTAKRANISASYEISESCDASAVGEAVLHALNAV